MLIYPTLVFKKKVLTPPPASLLLDQYPGATFAFSLKKLRNDYSGACIRVVRSSDNAEQDIGFAADGELDTTALLAFVGAGNGFITIWYNQSAINTQNAVQETLLEQPVIVSNGQVIGLNSKPTIDSGFPGNRANLRVDSVDNTSLFNNSQISVFLENSGGDNAIVRTVNWGNDSGNRIAIVTPDRFRLIFAVTVGSDVRPTSFWGSNTNLIKGLFFRNNNIQRIYQNDTMLIERTNATGALTGTFPLYLIADPNQGGSATIIRSVIIYPSDQEANRTQIMALM